MRQDLQLCQHLGSFRSWLYRHQLLQAQQVERNRCLLPNSYNVQHLRLY